MREAYSQEEELLDRLHELIQRWEGEIVEFKEADNSYKLGEIGQ